MDFENRSFQDAGRTLRLNFSNDLQEIVTLAAEACNTPAAALLLFDRTAPWISNRSNIDGRTVLKTATAGLRLTRQETGLVVLDPALDTNPAPDPTSATTNGLHFYAGVPLQLRGRTCFGALCVIDRHPRTITPEQASVLRLFSTQVMRLASLVTGAPEITDFQIEIQRQRILAQSRSLQSIASYLTYQTPVYPVSRTGRRLPQPAQQQPVPQAV